MNNAFFLQVEDEPFTVPDSGEPPTKINAFVRHSRLPYSVDLGEHVYWRLRELSAADRKSPSNYLQAIINRLHDRKYKKGGSK